MNITLTAEQLAAIRSRAVGGVHTNIYQTALDRTALLEELDAMAAAPAAPSAAGLEALARLRAQNVALQAEVAALTAALAAATAES